jgi:hypothetical protein
MHNGTYDIVQITIHDHRVLKIFSQWLNPIVNITKISTFDLAQRVFVVLQSYADDMKCSLPLKSPEELLLLQAD